MINGTTPYKSNCLSKVLVPLGPRVTAWRLTDVEAWEAEKAGV